VPRDGVDGLSWAEIPKPGSPWCCALRGQCPRPLSRLGGQGNKLGPPDSSQEWSSTYTVRANEAEPGAAWGAGAAAGLCPQLLRQCPKIIETTDQNLFFLLQS